MNSSLAFSGVYTALITPMKDGNVQWAELEYLVELQIKAGVDGLVPVGTTGESPTLNTIEHIRVIEEVVKAAKGRVPVIAGTGANSTQEALELTRLADSVGADGFLQVAPYYNKPSQAGLVAHFSKIAESTDKPIVLYSIPSRCGIDISVDTVHELAKNYPHVRTIKEAGGDVKRVHQLLDKCGSDLTVLSGDDGLVLDFVKAGAKGVISVASNFKPKIIKQLATLCLDHKWTEASALIVQINALLTDVIFLDGNPVSVKEAMFLEGLIASPEVRLPLVRMSLENQSRMKHALETLKD